MNGCKATPSANTEIAIVLAGGRSRRMGRDKARIEISPGTSLIEFQVQRLKALTPQVWVSGPYPEYDGFSDAVPDLGPLGGIAAAAARAPENARLLYLPVDMPFVPLTALRALLSAEASAVFFRDRELPAAFRNDVAFRARLAALLDPATPPGARSVRALLVGACALAPSGEDPRAFANLNSVSDCDDFGLRAEA